MKSSKFFAVGTALAVMLTAALAAGCAATHEHTLTRVAAQKSYCEVQGNIEYWVCEECGKYFADAAATQEISLEDTVLPYSHQVEYHEAVAADGVFSCDGIAYYTCTACGRYFADEAATQEITDAEIFTPKTFELTDASISDASAAAQTVRVYAVNEGENIDLAVTERNFVLRVFVGWEGAAFTDISQGMGARVNINIDTEDNIASGRWMSFRVGCNGQGGYAYFSDTKEIYFSSLENGGKLTNALRENSGLYVTLVRKGGTFTAYLEDVDGNLVKIDESQSFSDSALVKCTLGVHQGYYATEEHPAVLKDGVLVIGTTDPAAAKI